ATRAPHSVHEKPYAHLSLTFLGPNVAEWRQASRSVVVLSAAQHFAADVEMRRTPLYDPHTVQ
ncbi:MAG: hypothetical protein ACK42I_04415, partial [Thermomicrobium sp.]